MQLSVSHLAFAISVSSCWIAFNFSHRNNGKAILIIAIFPRNEVIRNFNISRVWIVLLEIALGFVDRAISHGEHGFVGVEKWSALGLEKTTSLDGSQRRRRVFLFFQQPKMVPRFSVFDGAAAQQSGDK
jgi:hypothetical protein